MRIAIVAAGALAPGDEAWLAEADLVIAADGGASLLEGLGRRPDVLVGDLDSTDPALVERLAATGTRVDRHPRDKEASDAQLALEAALAAGAERVVLLGATGGRRLDHELANLLLLADPALAGIEALAVAGPATVRALRGGEWLALRGAPGDLVTLLPVGGDAAGVNTAGLRWALDDATLRMGRSRGLSNVVDVPGASVRLDDGLLLVVEIASRGDLP